MLDKINRFLNEKLKKANDSKKKCILVVDDNEVDRKVICTPLINDGYKIIEAENGLEGLELARENKPDLIILDCEMPVMNGSDTCKELKDDDFLSKIPILFITAINTPNNIISCFDAEAENFLSKPIKPKVLLSSVSDILENAVTS